jgi:hypothetical protein
MSARRCPHLVARSTVGFQKSVSYVSSGFTPPFVLVDQATQNRSTRDAFMAEVGHGVVGLENSMQHP